MVLTFEVASAADIVGRAGVPFNLGSAHGSLWDISSIAQRRANSLVMLAARPSATTA